MNPTALNAWEMAAGVSASEASLTIRTLLLVTGIYLGGMVYLRRTALLPSSRCGSLRCVT